jgi:hypothetical protein
MRWLADECVDAALVRRLRGAGHDVIYPPKSHQERPMRRFCGEPMTNTDFC